MKEPAGMNKSLELSPSRSEERHAAPHCEERAGS